MDEASLPDTVAPQLFVVGIGASAGGITALQKLFESIPRAQNLAFVVVQHLLSDQPSQLARLFGAWTPLDVLEAASGVAIEPGHVYIAPPGRLLGIERGAFTTRPIAEPKPRVGIDTVDTFFEALAESYGARAIAVILSGTGADGAAGAVRVRQAGGVVLVQDPMTAMHDGMPKAVIANETADHIMPLAALAREIIACASPGYARSTSATTWAADVTKALDGMIDLIRARAGVDLTAYKTTPLLWRIQRRMELRRVPQFRDYEALLHDDSTELEALIRVMPIHVTEFFRDPSFWVLLERSVIPELLRDARDAPLRAWTPACSTGEEAYSLAMVLAEQAFDSKKTIDFQVFATDASAEIVARASRGVLRATAVNALSPERRQRFFYAADGSLRVRRSLREKMVFAPQDVLSDPPFSGLDLITCRNLLIYLEPEAAKRVVYLLHSSLRMGGYLFLGKSESLAPNHSGFEELSPGSRIYKKTGRAPDDELMLSKWPVRVSRPRSSRSAVDAHGRDAALEERDPLAVDIDDPRQSVDDADGLSRSPAPGAEPMDYSEALRLSHAELESSREELQALNEELRTSNEQLNVANEELYHANTQLREKLDQLETQSNVLSSGAVMTLFLDGELQIRFFTPALSELFPVRPSDVGRFITDLVPKFHFPSFIDDVRAVMRTGEPYEAEIPTFNGRWYLKRIRPFRARRVDAASAGVAITFTDITDRKNAEEALRQSEAALRQNQRWLAAQNEAFQAAMNGAPLATSLGILIRAAVDQSESERRCAFYIADAAGSALRHVVGMPDSYARYVEDFNISIESLACGLAVATGEPVITPDVLAEPRWEPWTWLAREFGYRGCWSFPVETSAGKLVGSFAMYFTEPREPTPRDRELATTLSQTAAIIISRHQETRAREA